MYRWKGTLYGRLVGFDYTRLRAACEYFNLVYYRPLEHMGEHGLTRLQLGIEAWHAKVLRGASLHPRAPRAAAPRVLIARRPAPPEGWRPQAAAFPGALPEDEWRAPASAHLAY